MVGLSRTTLCEQITIVTDKGPEWAIKKLYEALCKTTQWTAMVDSIVEKMSVSSKKHSEAQVTQNVLDLTEHYPLRICDYPPPASNTGFVYLLISLPCPDKMYVGQTGRSLRTRLKEHNKGKGSMSTAIEPFMPWGVGGFICNLGDMDKSERMVLETKWKAYNANCHNINIQQVLENGKRVAREHNDEQVDESKYVNFVQCVTPARANNSEVVN